MNNLRIPAKDLGVRHEVSQLDGVDTTQVSQMERAEPLFPSGVEGPRFTVGQIAVSQTILTTLAVLVRLFAFDSM